MIMIIQIMVSELVTTDCNAGIFLSQWWIQGGQRGQVQSWPSKNQIDKYVETPQFILATLAQYLFVSIWGRVY